MIGLSLLSRPGRLKLGDFPSLARDVGFGNAEGQGHGECRTDVNFRFVIYFAIVIADDSAADTESQAAALAFTRIRLVGLCKRRVQLWSELERYTRTVIADGYRHRVGVRRDIDADRATIAAKLSAFEKRLVKTCEMRREST